MIVVLSSKLEDRDHDWRRIEDAGVDVTLDSIFRFVKGYGARLDPADEVAVADVAAAAGVAEVDARRLLAVLERRAEEGAA